MQSFSFQFDLADLPFPANLERAARGLERWRESMDAHPELETFAKELLSTERFDKLLTAVFGNSPFLTLCLTREPQFFCKLAQEGPDSSKDRILSDVRELIANDPGRDALARHLRQAKRRMALVAGLADLSGAWALHEVTRALSELADATLGAACAHLLRACAERGAFTLKHTDDPQRDSGLVVLGMGKLGAFELNYSSDIDLIVLFDRDRVDTDDPENLQSHFVRLARNLVKLMEEPTADGYVFRTDLRLRPDPGSTPPALSVLAAETYYESTGQNWERAAFIKARPVAGDITAAKMFLKNIRPFIWRKSMDFAAIQDIHSIKRQINAHRGGATIALHGHNVKLGAGGIREIEFFAQTQQLIWGGREPAVRTPGTVDALRQLVALEQVDSEDAENLIQAYRYLRTLEHRLQMVNDAQTHSLPQTDEELADIAAFMGFHTPQAFRDKTMDTLRLVERLYRDLFEDAPSLSAGGASDGNLVFTGSEPDPETLKTLTQFGFTNVLAVDDTVRGWHHGRTRATRSTRAREILTEIMPLLLQTLAKTPEPDTALKRFDEFLSRLPAGVQLFAMFSANPQLLDLIIEIMGSAPRLAEHLARNPSILDGVLSAGFFEAPPTADEMKKDLEHILVDADEMESILDICRRWSKDRKFQVGILRLRNEISTQDGQRALSDTAEVLVNVLQPRIEAEFARQHGSIPGGEFAVVAYGKLGGREKTPTSDMDITFIYNVPQDVEASDGKRPLPPSQYYARLSQRMINALSAPTAEGVLYEVDMRLRPSGNAGPIASSLTAFTQYQQNEAWTWEHMALTRARPISGTDDFKRRIQDVITTVLTQPHEPDQLLRDVADMRQRMDKERHTENIWQVKNLRGGLVDIEFIAQYLQLRHAHTHPDVLAQNTFDALRQLQHAGVLDNTMGETLCDALYFWQNLQGMIRLTIIHAHRNHPEYVISETLGDILCRVGRVNSLAELEAKIKTTASNVLEIYNTLVEIPASELPPVTEELTS